MKTLNKYILEQIDTHQHFNYLKNRENEGIKNILLEDPEWLEDICIKNDIIERVLFLDAYSVTDENFFQEHKKLKSYIQSSSIKTHPLVTGINPLDMISVYESDQDFWEGFGEVYCKEKMPPKRHDFIWLEPLLEYCDNHRLPIYIHYDLVYESDYNKLYNILLKYKNLKLIHCHGGMNCDYPQAKVYQFIERLLEVFPNYFLDISWDGLSIVNKSRKKFKFLTKFFDRVLMGSDITPIWKEDIKREKTFKIIKELETKFLIKQEQTLKNIFI